MRITSTFYCGREYAHRMSKSVGTPATRRLHELGIPFTVHTYAHDPRTESYGLEAAAALGVDPQAVFKTLIAELDGSLVVGIVPVTAQLDLKAFAAALGGSKSKMSDVAAAERSSGYVAGGISPIGQKRPLPTVIDETAQLFDIIYVSGGKRGMDIALAPDDLVRATSAMYAPIAR